MAKKIKPEGRAPKPKPGQSPDAYWREREERQRAANIREEAKTAEKVNSIFQSMQDSIRQEIESFYQRYADKEGITIAEAKGRVSHIDMEQYERLAKKYVKLAHTRGAVKDMAFTDEANEQMRLYNATMRINRLEMLKARCGIRTVEGYTEAQKLINESLEDRAYSEYARLAGILGNSVQFNENMARAIVNASYQNATWSQRLWTNQSSLSSMIGTQLAQGILAGKSSTVLAREIQKLTGGGAYACQRLMRTELRRVQTEAAMQSMKDNGVTHYKFMVTNGLNPCEDCLALDGQVFALAEMAVGVNAPPRHPNCHCATAPYVDEAKWQRWLDGPAQSGVPWGEFEDGNVNSAALFRFQNVQNGGRDRSAREIEEVCKKIREEMTSYTDRESRWSGIINIKSKLGDGVQGLKEWNCSISVLPSVGDATLWHEMLHSASGSYYGEQGAANHRNIEEASVEYFTREICREKGIQYAGGYEDYVNVLDQLSEYLGYKKMIFAKTLYSKRLPDRYNWLEGQVRNKLKNDNAPITDYNDVIEYCRNLQGGSQ